MQQKVEPLTSAIELVISGMGAGIWDWRDITTGEEWWSPKFYELLGYMPGEIDASLANFSDLLHPDDKQPTFDLVEAHFKHGEKFEIEYRLRTKSGEYKWFLGSGQAQRDENGKPVRMAGSIIDIHARKVAEEMVQRSDERLQLMLSEVEDYAQSLKLKNEELELNRREFRDQNLAFEQVLEGTMAGFWDWNIPENTEYLSPTFKHMFGYEDWELENSPETWQKLIHPDDLQGVFDSFNAHVESKGETPYDNKVRYYHKDGSTVWVYCRGKVIEWAEDGSPIRMVGSHIDITSLKMAEEIIQEKLSELEFKNKELSQFAYVASHDLQEPLRTTTSYLELLEESSDGQLNDESVRYLMHVQNSAIRMRRLVKELLDYSRIGKEKEFILVDTNEVIKEVMADLSLIIEETATTIQHNELPTILALEVDFKQLLQNLISNAIKFKDPNGTPVIKVEAFAEKDFWHFIVEDNGIGIAERHMDRIFEIFQRLHRKDEYPGTGIGLALCKKIAEVHGGRIWVESSIGTGSKFHFTIKKKHDE